MTHKRANISRVASPQTANDLKRIKGIGPAIEKHLVSAGIETFVQLAELTPEAIAALVPNISVKRIANQNWIRQARKLAPDNDNPKPSRRKDDSSAPVIRQHYENFTFEFLLDENNQARRIRIMHIQSGDMDTWVKWDANDVIDFLAKHIGAQLSYGIPATPEADKTKVDTKTFLQTDDKIRLLKWTATLTDTNQPVRSFSHDQNFKVNLSLDLTHVPLSDESQLDITGTLFAKKLGSGSRKIIGEVQSLVPYAQVINLTVGETTLPEGLYRLEAFITLIPTETYPTAEDSIDATLQGGLFQVY